MLEIVEMLWPILVGVASFLVYKFVPYLQTKIFKDRYMNEDAAFLLVGYEMLGSILMQAFMVIAIIGIGKSTVDAVVLIEYIFGWLIVTILYLVGIVIVVWRKKKEGKKKYLLNIILGGFVHIALSIQLLLVAKNVYEEYIIWIFMFMVFTIVILQISENIEVKRVKNIKCVVYTVDNGRRYITRYEPIKRGKYYYVRMVNKDKKEVKRIQIPEERIERIEFIIENLKEKME